MLEDVAAQALLSAFSTQLAAYYDALPEPNTLAVPDSQYVASGAVAWDGESLTVYLGTIDAGQPGAPLGTSIPMTDYLFASTFYVQLIRAATAMSDGSTVADMVPDDATLNTEGVNSMIDAKALRICALQIKEAETLVHLNEGMVVGPVVPLGPQGGLSAVRIAIGLTLG